MSSALGLAPTIPTGCSPCVAAEARRDLEAFLTEKAVAARKEQAEANQAPRPDSATPRAIGFSPDAGRALLALQEAGAQGRT